MAKQVPGCHGRIHLIPGRGLPLRDSARADPGQAKWAPKGQSMTGMWPARPTPPRKRDAAGGLAGGAEGVGLKVIPKRSLTKTAHLFER